MTGLSDDLAGRILSCYLCRRFTRTGHQLSIEFSIELLKDANGQVEWIAALIRDVTERYERNKTLRTELVTLKAKTAIPSRPNAE